MALRVKKLGIFGQQKASTWDRVSRWGGTGEEIGEVSRRQTQGPDWGTERRAGFIQRVTEGLSRVLNGEVELSHQQILKDRGSCHEGPGCRMHVRVLVSKLCRALCDPMDYRPPGSSAPGFSRQESWRGLPCPPPGNLPNPRMEPTSPAFPALQMDS